MLSAALSTAEERKCLTGDVNEVEGGHLFDGQGEELIAANH